jgi:flagellar protein FlbD
MIKVTRLDGRQLVVNAELIELIESTPDTILSLTNEHKLIVRESLDDVVERVVAYRQRVYRQRPRLRVLTSHDS